MFAPDSIVTSPTITAVGAIKASSAMCGQIPR
jgi:hypothetical protein